MTRRTPTALACLLLAASAPACASTPRCATAPTGAVVRWADLPADNTARVVVLPAAAVAPTRLDASAGAVYLRFDTEGLDDTEVVERAALLLLPSPASRRERCALLRVRAVDEAWTAASVARGDRPGVGFASAVVALPAQRVPVRVDVTGLVRALGPDGLAQRGFAVTATEGGVVFLGSDTLAAEERPRLEVLLR